MPKDLYTRETEVLTRSAATLDAMEPEAAATRAYKDLHREYGRLLKTLKRIVRMNDRNEASLKDALENLRRTQEELIEAEKLASLGGLVAGVAHEVNTPLGIILTASTSLTGETKQLRNLAETGQARKSQVMDYFQKADEIVGLIHTHADKAAHLITSFKEVAVDQTSDTPRTFDLVDYVQEIVDSLRPEFKRLPLDVVVDASEPVTVYLYPGAIGQIVTNLVLNAVKHGLDGAAAGMVTLSVSRDGNEQVRLSCTDNGMGMSEDVRAKVFEPFFTTKRGRGGSGLGLHIIHNLVTGRLGGKIEVSSNPGDGTTFTVTFPAKSKTADDSTTANEAIT